MQDREPRAWRAGLFEGGKKGHKMREERVSAVLFESDMWKCDSVWGIESSVLCEVNWGRYPDTV